MKLLKQLNELHHEPRGSANLLYVYAVSKASDAFEWYVFNGRGIKDQQEYAEQWAQTRDFDGPVDVTLYDYNEAREMLDDTINDAPTNVPVGKLVSFYYGS